MQPSNSDPEVQIIRLPAVRARTGLATSSIYLAMQRGNFPRPISLSSKTVGWIASEIDSWILSRIAERNSKSSAAA
jgi:prophage regulatory protein